MNQANFFSETKTIKTRIALEEGAYEEQNYEVNTDFMVYLKDRTQLKDNDYLNKASLVILNSTMTSNEGEQELPSFDISYIKIYFINFFCKKLKRLFYFLKN